MSKAQEMKRTVAEAFGSGRAAPRLARIGEDPTPPRERPRVAQDVWDVPLGKIRPDPGQPRKTFDPDDLAALSASLKAKGQLQPCLAIQEEDGTFTLVCGESRWRAAPAAGLASLTCKVWTRASLADRGGLAGLRLAQVAENWMRADPPPMELAAALAELVELGVTQAQLGERLGKNQQTISDKLRLLKLPAATRELVASGDLAPESALALLRLGDDDLVDSYARTVVAEGRSRAQVRTLVATILARRSDAARPVASKPVDTGGRYKLPPMDSGRPAGDASKPVDTGGRYPSESADPSPAAPATSLVGPSEPKPGAAEGDSRGTRPGRASMAIDRILLLDGISVGIQFHDGREPRLLACREALTTALAAVDEALGAEPMPGKSRAKGGRR